MGQTKKHRVAVLLNPDDFARFKQFCDKHDTTMSEAAGNWIRSVLSRDGDLGQGLLSLDHPWTIYLSAEEAQRLSSLCEGARLSKDALLHGWVKGYISHMERQATEYRPPQLFRDSPSK